MTSAEFQLLVERHVADLWSEPGSDVAGTKEFLASFGIDPVDATTIAAEHTRGGELASLSDVAGFMSGLILGLWLARELEAATLTVERDHYREAAHGYGRVLQALAARAGGVLELDRAELLNDATMVVVEADGDEVRVTLEEAPGARER